MSNNFISKKKNTEDIKKHKIGVLHIGLIVSPPSAETQNPGSCICMSMKMFVFHVARLLVPFAFASCIEIDLKEKSQIDQGY